MVNNHFFDTIIYNGYLVIDNGQGLLLIDTGSPLSFHRDGKIDIANITVNVPSSYMGIDPDYLSKKIRCTIAGMLGMDIIRMFSVCIESDTYPFANCVGFYNDPPMGNLAPGAFSIMGSPGIFMNVNGKMARVLFDTGAPVSYIDKAFIEGAPYVHTVKDFAPILGEESYMVDLFKTTSVFNSREFDVNFGVMPSSLSKLLRMHGVDGIIGYDLIKHFRINLHKGMVHIPPQGI